VVGDGLVWGGECGDDVAVLVQGLRVGAGAGECAALHVVRVGLRLDGGVSCRAC